MQELSVFQKLPDFFEIKKHRFFLMRIAQQGGGVKDGHVAAAVFFKDEAVLLRDAKIRTDESHRGDAAETDDEPRSDQFDLPVEVGRAEAHLLRQRIPVVRGAAFQNICDVILLFGEPDRLEISVEQLARRTDEGLTRDVFIRPRCFPDKEQLRPLIPPSEDDLVPGLVQRAEGARLAGLSEFCQHTLPFQTASRRHSAPPALKLGV